MNNRNQFIALLLVVAVAVMGIIGAATASPVLSSEVEVSRPRPIPVPDEDINQYIGQVIEASLLSHIYDLLSERYPGYQPSTCFKPIDYDTSWTTDPFTGQTIYMMHFRTVLLASVEIYPGP